jgi:hypothetical protein
MTNHDRSPDDMPLAAYGGSGMELTEDDQARLEAAAPLPADADSAGPAGSGSAAPGLTAPGPFAHAVVGAALPGTAMSGVAIPGAAAGTGQAVAPRALPPLVAKTVATLRTSRLAAGSLFAGVILVGLLLLNGGNGNPGAAGAQASPSPAPVVTVTAEPGNATLVVVGKTEQSFTLAGASGSGAPGGPLSVTWADATANTLGLHGSVDRGVRTTAESLVLSFTVLLDGTPVTFTSTDGECTIGMAVHPRNVSGTFSCKKLKSDDGKITVRATGSYRT